MPQGVELCTDFPEGADKYITTDAVRLKQVLNNLINNAKKFTVQGSITLGYRVDESGYTTVFVEDTGAGENTLEGQDMTDNTQPEAGSTHIIRFALELGLLWIDGSGRDKVREALNALDALEAQLEAIGAGGVSGPLMGRAAPPTAQAEGWRLVPVEPTLKMLFVAMNAFVAASASLGAFNAPNAAYRALLAAAPTHPTSSVVVEHG
jgi:hypothetical protein